MSGDGEADDTGWEVYHHAMFTLDHVTDPFARRRVENDGFRRWKVASVGVNVARQYAVARNRRRPRVAGRARATPAAWPLPHPPAVLYSGSPAAGCLRCLRFDHRCSGRPVVEEAAREHAREHLPTGRGRWEAARLTDAPFPLWKP